MPNIVPSEILSISEFTKKFSTEEKARKYFESRKWPQGRSCPYCGSCSISEISHHSMPYRCCDCRKYFSVRTGTILEKSKLSFRQWLLAIYILTSSRKGVSSIYLAKQVGITQKTAWFLTHRIRAAYELDKEPISGEVEIDETFIGGKQKNKHRSKRIKNASGWMGKIPVMGIRERTGKVRAFIIKTTTRNVMQTAVRSNVASGSTIYTDYYNTYEGMPEFTHYRINHSAGEYSINGIHTNSIESFWALLKRGYYGTYHYMSPKHLQRYLNEFCSRYNVGHDTIENLEVTVDGMIGKRLTYDQLVKENKETQGEESY